MPFTHLLENPTDFMPQLSLRVLPDPDASEKQSKATRPVMIDAGLQVRAKLEAAKAQRPLAELVAVVFQDLLTPGGIESLLPLLPPFGTKRSPETATAAVYLPARLHAHLKIKAAQHERKLYELVEARLRQILPPPPPES